MKADKPRVVALIPARSGSKRVAGKNVRRLAGHPLMAYTIAAARASGVFDAIILSTDAEDYASIGRYYGAEVPFLRPGEFAGSQSPDIEWVECTLKYLSNEGREFDCFSILRPTSPFRQAETIQAAWKAFSNEQGVDSLRAVEKCTQHPGKMWVVNGKRMTPLLPLGSETVPWHSSQYDALPTVYVQNASLEIAWTRVLREGRTIAGTVLIPFETSGLEGFDINTVEDWWRAEFLIEAGDAVLPSVSIKSYEAN
ncbi:MAG TPA: acylneuraminate cytidylyltransferase family protein [Acidiferrobacteraceae bacterium]|nr:acylneuraminate cytidylyltransferase family protein [Acidiferrobacteraceae bacterium]